MEKLNSKKWLTDGVSKLLISLNKQQISSFNITRMPMIKIKVVP